MRILVTGHLGYIGAVLVPMLQRLGHDVVGIDAGFFLRAALGTLPAPVPMIAEDVRDVDVRDLQGIDAVIHLAALSNDPMGSLDPDLTRQINFDATVALARAARDAGVERFLLSSSCSVYGAAHDTIVDESSPTLPLTAYAESKIRSEEALERLATTDFVPVFLRNATAFGFSPRLRTDLVVNDFVCTALVTGEVRIKSSGTSHRPLVHVIDIACAFVAMLDAPADAVRGRAFNVGRDEENHRVRDLATIVQDVISDCSVAIGTSADARDYRVSFARVRAALPNLELTWSVRAGAADLYERARAARFGAVDLAEDRYVRLADLKRHRESGRLDAALRWTGIER
jgi:nucleoside-diphosphate-sugar epimerase